MKMKNLNRLLLSTVLLTAPPLVFSQGAFPANAIEAGQQSVRTDLEQTIAGLKQQQSALQIEIDTYTKTIARLKQEAMQSEKTQKDSAASIASLTASIQTLSAQEKTLSTKLSMASEKEGNISSSISVMTKELETLQERVAQEKSQHDALVTTNVKEQERLQKELADARKDQEANLAQLDKTLAEKKEKNAQEESAIDTALVEKKAAIEVLDKDAEQKRVLLLEKAYQDIAVLTTASKEQIEQFKIAETSAHEEKLKASEAELATRLANLEKAEKDAIAVRANAEQEYQKSLEEKRALATKQLDALEEDAKQIEKETAAKKIAMLSELETTRDEMLKKAKDEVENTKNQEKAALQVKQNEHSAILKEADAKLLTAETRLKEIELKMRAAEIRVDRLAQDQQAWELKQSQRQSAPVSSAQKDKLENDIQQLQRKLEGLQSDDLVKQIKIEVIPE